MQHKLTTFKADYYIVSRSDDGTSMGHLWVFANVQLTEVFIKQGGIGGSLKYNSSEGNLGAEFTDIMAIVKGIPYFMEMDDQGNEVLTEFDPNGD